MIGRTIRRRQEYAEERGSQLLEMNRQLKGEARENRIMPDYIKGNSGKMNEVFLSDCSVGRQAEARTVLISRRKRSRAQRALLPDAIHYK